MVSFDKYEKISEKLKALAHPHRLCIVKGLMEKTCNVSNMQECLKLPQSTVSQHIAKLKSVGIIKGERFGVEIRYYVVDKETIEIIKCLFP